MLSLSSFESELASMRSLLEPAWAGRWRLWATPFSIRLSSGPDFRPRTAYTDLRALATTSVLPGMARPRAGWPQKKS